LQRTSAGIPCVRAFDELPEPNPDRLKKLTVEQVVLN